MSTISKKEFNELKRLHYELWDYLAKNPNKSKLCGFEKHDEYKYVLNMCFACLFASKITDDNEIFCNYCPITDMSVEHCTNGLYDKYDYTRDFTKRTYYAEKIRDLEWKENNCLEYVKGE